MCLRHNLILLRKAQSVGKVAREVSTMAICPKKSCKGRLLCLGGVSVILTVLVLPTIFFYSWRDSNVNNWRDQTEMLEVYNYINDCTSNITAEENKTQVRICNAYCIGT